MEQSFFFFFLTVRVVEYWNRLAREVAESPNPRDIQKPTGHGSRQPVLVDPTLSRENWMISKGPLEAELFCDSIIQPLLTA